MEQSTWTAALVPWVHSLGVLFANLGVILLVVLMAMFCGAAMVGSKRKSEEERGPSREDARRALRAVRVVRNPRRMKSKGESKPWSL